MLGPLLLLQLAVVAPHPESTYSTTALASFIAEAAAKNRVPPPALRGYRARVESELSLIVRDTLGRERAAQVEQFAMNATWDRGQRYDLRVVGYRSESVGVPYSAMSFARSWTIPYLYGDRLTLGVDFSTSGSRQRPDTAGRKRQHDRAGDTLHAVHPLALDRERYYRYSGGDTIALLRSRERTIPIVRVHVRPVFDSAARETRIAAFEGEIDFDAVRFQIVRMRGQFVATPGPTRSRPFLARLPGIVAVAYVEYVNAEVDGQYWLPAFQRSEFQASIAPLGAQRSIFRLVSRFAGLDVDQDLRAIAADSASVVLSARDQPEVIRRRLTFAPADSVSRFRDWIQPLGGATESVSGSDFDDLAPDAWRADGPPRFDFTPTKLDEIFRYNRVEGAYTGLAMGERFRDALPGLTAHAYGGWAWGDQTPRGGASLIYGHGPWTTALRAERILASTNDFTPPLEGGSDAFGALFFGVDDQDYVERNTASASLTRAIGSVHGALITLQGGVAGDRSRSATIDRSMLGIGHFRINRASALGNYVLATSTLEIHPDVTGVFLEPGIGLTASYQVASGDLAWRRSELTVAARRNISDFVIAAVAQGGIVQGRSIPPQALFELGGENALPGYEYKEFAGDRSATGGILTSYTFPVLRRPWRIVRSFMLPGLSPGLATGVQGGWAEASNPAVLASIQRLDPNAAPDCAALGNCPAPLSVPTNGVRATVDVRLTFFGGLIGVGVARVVDRASPWRLAFRFGQEY